MTLTGTQSRSVPVLMSRKIDVVALAPKGKVAKMSARPHLHLALRSNFMVSLLLLPHTLSKAPRARLQHWIQYSKQKRMLQCDLLIEVMANSMERGLLEWGAEIISIIEMGWVNRKHAVMVVRELCASRWWYFELVRWMRRVARFVAVHKSRYVQARDLLGMNWDWAFILTNPCIYPT